ncbi:MAG: hypothetical protein AMXMBFR64_50050 [Myxococcales bacterium]
MSRWAWLVFAWLLCACQPAVRPDPIVPPAPVVVPQAQLDAEAVETAEALLDRGDYREALAALADVPPVDPTWRGRWRAASVAAAFRIGDLARVQGSFLAASEPPDEGLDAYLDALVETGAAYAIVLGVDPQGPLGHYVIRRAVRDLEGRGAFDEAATLASTLLSRGIADMGLRGELEALVRRYEARSGTDWKVGVLLPLSGPYQAIGQSALRSVQLALLDAGSPANLAVRDTRGDGARAAEGAEELVLSEQVAAVLGPVGVRETTDAASVLQDLAVPHVVLSSVSDLGGDDTWGFRLRATDRQVTAEVLRTAAGMGIKTVAILHPDSGYGREVAAIARDLAPTFGLTAVGVVSYPAGTSDFREAIRALRQAAGGLPDSLFVPDSADAGRRLGSYLRAAGVPLRTSPGVRGVQLLGGSGWLDPRLIDPAERTTDNAVFAAPFFPDPSDPRARGFVDAFIARFAVGPTPFEAETYDSVRVLLDAMARAGGGADREALRRALRETVGHVGVTGVLSIRPDGTATRLLPVLTVDGDAIRLRGSEDEERAVRGGR